MVSSNEHQSKPEDKRPSKFLQHKRETIFKLTLAYKYGNKAAKFFGLAAGGLKGLTARAPFVVNLLYGLTQLMFSHQYMKRMHSAGISRADIAAQCGIAVVNLGIGIAGLVLLAGGAVSTPALVAIGIGSTFLGACANLQSLRIINDDPEYKMGCLLNFCNLVDPDLANEIG